VNIAAMCLIDPRDEAARVLLMRTRRPLGGAFFIPLALRNAARGLFAQRAS
jgi:hypothetical protein